MKWSRWRWSNLKLREKALIAVALPLVAVIAASLLFHRFEREADDAEAAANPVLAIKTDIDGLLRLASAAEASARAYTLPKQPPVLDLYNVANRDMPGVFAHLEQLMRESGQNQPLDGIRAALALVRMEILAEAARKPEDRNNRPGISVRGEEAVGRLRAELYGLRDKENNLLAANSERLNAARARVRAGTWSSLIFGCLGAVLAMMLFTSGVVWRIENLELNVILLAQGLPLRPARYRNDELGRLDRGLFRASELLAEREAGREAAQLEVRSTNAKLTAVLDSATQLAIVATDIEGIVSVFNSGAERMLGYSASKVIGRELPNILLGSCEGDGKGTEPPVAATDDGQGYWDRERTYVHKDGAHIIVSETVTPIGDSHGRLCGFLRIAADITAHKRIQRDLQQAKQSAEAANRSKTEFLARMSHEIRTPMNAIFGMAQLLYETELTDEQRQYTRIFCTNTERLLNLINDILDLSKVEAGNLELDVRDFDLYRVVEDTAELIADWAHRRGLEFTCYIAPQTPSRLRGDPQRLEQVLVNLVGNAVKFAEAGEVCLRVEPNPEGPGSPLLKFSVSDTGPGIPEDKRDLVFQSFAQGDSTITRKFGGTGLGLAISKSIIELMGGKIWIESEVGRGSTFHFTTDFAVDLTPGKSFEIPPEIQNLRVLIADDAPTTRQALREMLTGWGLAAEEAAGGQEALAELEGANLRKAPYDVMLLDYQMPGLNGLDIANRVRRDPLHQRLVVMMLTSDPNRTDAVQCREADIATCPKPVMMRALFEALTTAFLRKVKAPKPSVRENLPAARPHRILLADDSSDNRFLVRAYIKNRPYKVEIAENGKIAVEMAARTKYDLILMDVQMPVMDGYTATRKIRLREETEGGRPVPIVALTAHALLGDLQRSRAAGCNDHLTKPISRPDLLDAIERHSLVRSLKIRVAPTDGLEAIVPGYLEARAKEVAELNDALAQEDFDRICVLGHNMKGTGTAYGFPAITEIGAALESGAKSADPEEIRLQTAALGEFLAQVELVTA